MPCRSTLLGRLTGPCWAKSTGDFTAFIATTANGTSITTARAASATRTMDADGPRRLRPLRPVPRAAPRAACEITDMSGLPLVPGLHAEDDRRQRHDVDREHPGDGCPAADRPVLDEVRA